MKLHVVIRLHNRTNMEQMPSKSRLMESFSLLYQSDHKVKCFIHRSAPIKLISRGEVVLR